jgi:hypothetical protein
MKKTAILLSVSLISATFLKAQDTAKAPAKSPFTFGGYIDSYYTQNLNNPKSGLNLGQSGMERAFDQRANTIGLGLVQTKFGYSNNKSDVVVDLTFGPNADMGNYGNSPTLSWNPSKVASGASPAAYFYGGIAIKQAYFNYKATDKLTFTAGQFGTHIGTEVIDAPINYNYSLSNLFNNGPFYHIGVKANYAFSDKFALMAGVVNNVDALYDNNRAKGIIAQMFLSPVKGWNVYINYIGSNEANPSAAAIADTANKNHQTAGFYQLIDLTTGYQMTDKFYMGINAAYGSQRGDYQGNGIPNVNAAGTKDSTRHWGGAALYMNYQFTGIFGLGLRAEHFDNSSGVRSLRNTAAQTYYMTNTVGQTGSKTGGTSVNSITLTGVITLAEGHFLLKPEVRMDMYKKNAYTGAASSDIQQFQDSKGYFTKTSQTTIGLALIYKY